MEVLSDLLLKVLNFLTPSTQTSMREMVPVTVAAACAATGEASFDPLTGLHTLRPGEAGELHEPPPLTVAVTVCIHLVPAVFTA